MKKGLLLITLLLSTNVWQQMPACTGIVRKADNGDVVYARTMEFGSKLISFNLLTVPKDVGYTAQTVNGKEGTSWTSKYNVVGFAPFGLPLLADGLNDQGLACGAFYFPGWTEYQTLPDESEEDEAENNIDKIEAISNLDVVSWILSSFNNVEAVRQGLEKIKVYGVILPELNSVLPLHYMVVDAEGHKAVIEYIKGKLNIYEAPLNTITNAPSYDWHNTNARHYIGSKALNAPNEPIEGKEFTVFGQGSGAIGLPGDFSSPSRFIKAAFLGQVTIPGKNGLEEIRTAFKILNQFDIPAGAVRSMQDDKETLETTQWTSASDLRNLQYYFHTHFNRALRAFDLKAWKPQDRDIKVISLMQGEKIHFIKIDGPMSTSQKNSEETKVSD